MTKHLFPPPHGAMPSGNAGDPAESSFSTHIFLLKLLAPLFLCLLGFGTAAVILGESAGAAARFHWIVATLSIFAVFFLGNKFAIQSLASGCAAGETLSILTACLWFPFSALVFITFAFVAIAHPHVERLQQTALATELRVFQENAVRQESGRGKAGGKFAACAAQLSELSRCERRGCVSGQANRSVGAISPVADFLKASAAICQKASEDFARAERERASRAREARDAIAAFETARHEALPKGTLRRTHLFQKYLLVTASLEQMKAASPVAAGTAVADQLKNARPGVTSDTLRDGADVARRVVADEGERIATFFATIDDQPRNFPRWPDASPLVAVFDHLDQTWLHLLAAIGAEALPLLLFIFAVGAERRRRTLPASSLPLARGREGWH